MDFKSAVYPIHWMRLVTTFCGMAAMKRMGILGVCVRNLTFFVYYVYKIRSKYSILADILFLGCCLRFG